MGIFDRFKTKFSKARCASCGKGVVPFADPPRGMVEGKLVDLPNDIDLVTQLPNMEAYHGVVCERCGAVFCTVCFVTGLPGMSPSRDFLCRQCGSRPVPKVYRG